MRFKQWLEDVCGEVNPNQMVNTAVDDGFERLKSKYMAGTRLEKKFSFDPDRMFKMLNKYKRRKNG